MGGGGFVDGGCTGRVEFEVFLKVGVAEVTLDLRYYGGMNWGVVGYYLMIVDVDDNVVASVISH